ncbi:MAG: DUF996 domain-containing protein [Candidatus Bathyarchaeota archaeon]|nr:DUF996 domain-containing protein [Candidatus Bathyarchaeota archaeon]
MNTDYSRNFESNRTLGGVGALLSGIGSLVLFSGSVGIVGIVGMILVLLSLRGLAEDFKEPAISRTATSGFIFGITGILIAVMVFQAFAFLSGFIFVHPVMGALGSVMVIGAWFLMFIFLLIAALFFRRAFRLLASKSREGLLRTGGLLLLFGGALTIVFAGFFLLFVGWILTAIGLFQLKPPMQPEQVYTSPHTSTYDVSASGTANLCPHCGAENTLDGTFCTHCGRRLNST